MPRTSPRPTNNSSLARLRIARGMTQSQLAAKIGCTQVDLSRWERGIHSPNSRWLPLIAAALNCSIDDISKED